MYFKIVNAVLHCINYANKYFEHHLMKNPSSETI